MPDIVVNITIGDSTTSVVLGLAGAPGVGVPAGGTTGQALVKASGTDYDTTWASIGGGGGSGTVTSVGLAGPSIFRVSGSPVTTAGTLTLALASQNPNLVFAGPASGGAAAPTFRALAAADIPAIPESGVTNLVSDLAGKLAAANDLSDLASAATARTNLGLGTAATHDVPASGNASAAQVVTGSDTRLTDSRAPTGSAGGDLTGTYPNPTLAGIIAAGGPTGSASVVPVITYDAKGRLTAVTSATITPGAIGAPSGSGTCSGTNTGDQYQSTTDNRVIGRSAGSAGPAGEIALDASMRWRSHQPAAGGPYTALGTTGTVTADLNASNRFKITPTAAVTLALTNDADGDQFTIDVSSSAFSVTWWSGVKWAGGSPPSQPPASGHVLSVAFKRLASGNYLGYAADCS